MVWYVAYMGGVMCIMCAVCYVYMVSGAYEWCSQYMWYVHYMFSVVFGVMCVVWLVFVMSIQPF